jgi:threonine dehydratase
VLLGFQVPRGGRTRLRKAVREIPYPMVEESDNPAYHLFLD